MSNQTQLLSDLKPDERPRCSDEAARQKCLGYIKELLEELHAEIDPEIRESNHSHLIGALQMASCAGLITPYEFHSLFVLSCNARGHSPARRDDDN